MLLMDSLQVVQRDSFLFVATAFFRPLITHVGLTSEIDDPGGLLVEHVIEVLVHFLEDSVLHFLNEPEIPHEFSKDMLVSEDAPLGDFH